jgi:DNA-binding transcriptional ArsR family regulator
MSQTKNNTEAFGEETALTTLLGDHPKVKMLSVLIAESRDITVSQIAERAGISRSTVYDHIEDLQEIGIVDRTRKVGGSPLYQIDRENDTAEQFAQLEWTLLDDVAELYEDGA